MIMRCCQDCSRFIFIQLTKNIINSAPSPQYEVKEGCDATSNLHTHFNFIMVKADEFVGVGHLRMTTKRS